MALLIHPSGKQEFITLHSDDLLGRQQELTALFGGDEARTFTGSGPAVTSMAYRLKFVQAVFMAFGTEHELNHAASRFGEFKDMKYWGTVAFLREEEKING